MGSKQKNGFVPCHPFYRLFTKAKKGKREGQKGHSRIQTYVSMYKTRISDGQTLGLIFICWMMKKKLPLKQARVIMVKIFP